MTAESTDPFEAALRKAEALADTSTELPVAEEHAADLVPDIEYERRPEDIEIDRVLDGIDILTAYQRWCGKMTPQVGSKRESVMISCPIPGHRDEHPSAWMNLDKGTWYCAACSQGGDKYDIAAWFFGFDVPGYKDKGIFPELRRQIAADFGVSFLKVPGGSVMVPTERESSTDEGTGDLYSEPPSPESETELATIHPLRTIGDEEISGDDDETIDVSLPWEEMFPEKTFIREYIEVCNFDSCTTEYHVFNGLIAVSQAIGRDVHLPDNPNVIGNLFICHYGDSGSGKSKATSSLIKLLNAALPYDHADLTSTGSRHIGSPSSAEILIDQFHKPEYDPADPTKLIGLRSVRGLVTYSELSELAVKAARLGNPIKAVLMALYDGYGDVTTMSRGGGSVSARDAYCSCVSSTQPGAVKSLLSTEDTMSGFLNRWVFPAGRRKKRTMFDGKMVDISTLINPLRELRAWASKGVRLKISEDAHEVLTEWFDAFSRMTVGDKNPLLNRADLTLKKLMLLMAVNERKTEIDADLARRALLFWPYLVVVYEFFGQRIGSSAPRECADALERILAKFGRAVSTAEIIKFSRIDRKYDLRLIDETLGYMVKLGKIDVLQSTRGSRGRPTIRYRYINPTSNPDDGNDETLPSDGSPATL